MINARNAAMLAACAVLAATAARDAHAQPTVPPTPPAQPTVTYALLPGHWQLRGATYEWVPPETTLRRVQDRQLVEGRFVWRDGAWKWVATHYAD